MTQQAGISYGTLRFLNTGNRSLTFKCSGLQAKDTFRLNTWQDYFLCLVIFKDFKVLLNPSVEDKLLYRTNISNCYMERRKSGFVLNVHSDIKFRDLDGQGEVGWSLAPGGSALVCPQCDRKPRVPSREAVHLCIYSALVCTQQLRFWLQDHEVLDSLPRLIRKMSREK